MVTVKLYGRMANQMSQIAACICYGLTHNMNWHVPWQSERPADWPCYFPHLTSHPAQSNVFFDYKELPNQTYREIPYYPNIRLDGHFHSEKYFKHCRHQIVAAFDLPWTQLKNTVSIHVRRADYLDYPEKHPVVHSSYILRAMAYFLLQKNITKFMFFSDDIDWCKEFVKTDLPKAISHPNLEIIYSEDRQPIEDMALMSSCEHNIICNSSFSWWGAWLNRNPDKVVIAPEVWTKVSIEEWDTTDICPDTWVRM